jgi:endo-1,4-beta-xylanase
MINRRALLAGGASLIASPALAQTMPASAGTLRALAAAKGLLFGAATATYELKDADFVAALARDAAILVPEYEMKRTYIERQPGAYDFSVTDNLMRFARAHGMAMRGHPLVWYYANPPWLEQKVLSSPNEKPLTDYVAALAHHYRGRMQSWDVVNEALAPDGSGWRDCFWLRRYGPAYLDLAFHAAHAADPRALLVYNDFGCEQGTPVNDRFRAQTLKLLDGLLKRKVPVGALGLQAHLSAFGAKVDQKKLGDFLTEIRARRLAVLVTELDVDDEGGPSDFSSRDRAVADEASRFLDVVLDSAATKAVLTWSLSDRYLDPPVSWRLQLLSWRDRKAPYDSQMNRKPLWSALAKAFANRRVRM